MKRFFPFFIFGVLIIGSVTQATGQSEVLKSLFENAGKGDADALYRLARLYDFGYDSIPADTAKSTALYLEAARKGSPAARNLIGFRYYRGEVVQRNVDSAMYWIRIAADEGDLTAAANLAYLLTESDVIRPDSVEAFKWLAKAVAGGVPETSRKLVALSENLAEKGYPEAKAILADAFSKGIGVPYDHKKSVQLFFEAAKSGNGAAQFILAELLEFFPDTLNELDSEILPEEKNAHFWYEKAAGHGILDSEEAYKALFFTKNH